MIWIATLCLLAVIAWLFFNALNERRWVEAHSHDESVAADPGFLPEMSGFTSKLMPASDGKRSLQYENSSLSRAVDTVRERSAKAGETIERRVAEVRTGGAGDTALGRAIEKITGTARELDAKLDQRSRENATAERHPGTGGGSLLGRTTARVAQKQKEYSALVRERVARTDRVDGGSVGKIVDANGDPIPDTTEKPATDTTGRPAAGANEKPATDATGRPASTIDRKGDS